MNHVTGSAELLSMDILPVCSVLEGKTSLEITADGFVRLGTEILRQFA